MHEILGKALIFPLFYPIYLKSGVNYLIFFFFQVYSKMYQNHMENLFQGFEYLETLWSGNNGTTL